MMTDGTVKVTAEAHLHITQLMNLLQGPLGDVLSQVTSHGLALTDPNVWAGPAASVFSGQVWPALQSQVDALRGALGDVQSQVGGILSSITSAGSGGLPIVGSLPVVGPLTASLTGSASGSGTLGL